MHIAYLHQHFVTPDGAAGTRSYELARRLVEAGHRVTMVCGWFERLGEPPVEGRERRSTVAGIDVIRLGVAYRGRMSFWQRVRAFGAFARAAVRPLVDSDADLVFATSTPLTVGVPGMKAARRLGVPFVFEVRDLWPELPIAMGIIRNPALKWYLRRLERRIYRAATRVVGLAPGIVDGIVDAGVPREQVALIPNGCDLELFTPSDDKRDPDTLELVFCGAHGLANGLDAIVDAAAELRRREERGIRFVMIGDGPTRDGLVARTADEGLEPWIDWRPPVPKHELASELPRYDAGLQILADIPAFYRGTSPNKFFDYLAAGLPVVNNYPGWLADAIGEHRCGLATTPRAPAALADAAIWLRDHPDERRAMGRRARALAESRFDRDQLADEFVRWLTEAERSTIAV